MSHLFLTMMYGLARSAEENKDSHVHDWAKAKVCHEECVCGAFAETYVEKYLFVDTGAERPCDIPLGPRQLGRECDHCGSRLKLHRSKFIKKCQNFPCHKGEKKMKKKKLA